MKVNPNHEITDIHIQSNLNSCVIQADGDFIINLGDFEAGYIEDYLEEVRAKLQETFASIWGELKSDIVVYFDFELED